MSDIQDLELIIRSRVAIVAIESDEEQHVLNIVFQAGRKLSKPVYRWSITEGLRAIEPDHQPEQSIEQPIDVLGYIKVQGKDGIFVLLDYHHYLKDPVHIRLLKDIALAYTRLQCTVILVSHQIDMPEELKRFSGYFALPLPGPEELKQIIYDVAAEWSAEHGDKNVEATNKSLDMLLRNLIGLTESDARRLARNVIYDNGAIAPSAIPAVMRAKYELLNRDGLLTFEYDTARFSDVGGLSRLKTWLDQRKPAFLADDDSTGLDAPKGILLLGIQGCGKSLAAKAAAGVFGVPLLRLDFGVLYNKYFGETERNLRESLNTASVMAPCVLWMDEIEKGLAVSDSDEGVSRRVLGTLLTWMAEKHALVFMVATANDIACLPPELVRKGRFDETFFVDLPSADVRREIFKIHLAKRAQQSLVFHLDQFASASEGFSGAEIEQALVSALYTARSFGRDLTAQDLLAEMRATRPLSVVMAERVEELRRWAADRTVPCD